jgi:UDP-glucose 4-epimerase
MTGRHAAATGAGAHVIDGETHETHGTRAHPDTDRHRASAREKETPMLVTVTGGSGYIGSHVVDKLVRAGHRVRVIDSRTLWRNPDAEYIVADLFDEAALATAVAGTDAVFHLAALTDVDEIARDPLRAVRLNVDGTARVLEAVRADGGTGRTILASTVWVYGAAAADGTGDGTPGELTEDVPVDLSKAGHVYVATKLSAELLLHSYRTMYGQPFTILRYGIPYGPRMRDELVVARFVKAGLAGSPITIAGTGDQTRRFVYVEDLAAAHVAALSPAADGRTLALEGDTEVSIRELADTVGELLGSVDIEHVPARAADYKGRPVSNRAAKEVLNWSPGTPLTVGVRRYLDWLRA